jgi:hypothetical protein
MMARSTGFSASRTKRGTDFIAHLQVLDASTACSTGCTAHRYIRPLSRLHLSSGIAGSSHVPCMPDAVALAAAVKAVSEKAQPG